MEGLGKHVDGLHPGQRIALLAQQSSIAGERGRIAGDIGDRPRSSRPPTPPPRPCRGRLCGGSTTARSKCLGKHRRRRLERLSSKPGCPVLCSKSAAAIRSDSTPITLRHPRPTVAANKPAPRISVDQDIGRLGLQHFPDQTNQHLGSGRVVLKERPTGDAKRRPGRPRSSMAPVSSSNMARVWPVPTPALMVTRLACGRVGNSLKQRSPAAAPSGGTC